MCGKACVNSGAAWTSSLFFILTRALGIGAYSSIFSVVEAVLLRPLPYRGPAALATLFSKDPAPRFAA
jgi:putative ABC transport system permease protein